MVVDKLKSENLKGVVVAKTNVFMNESGLFVKKLTNTYSLVPNDLYIIHDDLDIRLGEYKIQLGKGPKNHGGLESIDVVLGTSDYWHVRVGVDNRDPENRTPGEIYVLQDFTGDEEVKLEGTIKKLVEDLCKKLATS